MTGVNDFKTIFEESVWRAAAERVIRGDKNQVTVCHASALNMELSYHIMPKTSPPVQHVRATNQYERRFILALYDLESIRLRFFPEAHGVNYAPIMENLVTGDYILAICEVYPNNLPNGEAFKIPKEPGIKILNRVFVGDIVLIQGREMTSGVGDMGAVIDESLDFDASLTEGLCIQWLNPKDAIKARADNVVLCKQLMEELQKSGRVDCIVGTTDALPSASRAACLNCGLLGEGPQHKCSRCLRAYYCSRDCQVDHWVKHKTSCKKQ